MHFKKFYKLLMNSAYGKLTLKPEKYKKEHVPQKKYQKKYRPNCKGDVLIKGEEILRKKFNKKDYDQAIYIIKRDGQVRLKTYWHCTNEYFLNDYVNNHDIVSYTPVNKNEWCVKRYALDDSFSYVPSGSAILSMSKVILYEVLNTANDIKAPVFYTDTDSIHIFKRDIPRLSEAFKKKYDRELIGKNLGQFHSDFDPLKSFEANSILFIPIAPKTYYDLLFAVDEKTGEVVVGEHFRTKGIPLKSLLYHKDKYYGGDLLSLYKDLASRKRIEITLNPTPGIFRFDLNAPAGGVETKKIGSFVRTLQF